MTSIQYSIVIPVYNDLPALKKAIPETLNLLKSGFADFELIIAEDASSDGSSEYASLCAEDNPCIRHFHRDERAGRGSALSVAAKNASGEIFCYFDVDLATDMASLPDLIRAIQDGADIATGSRLLTDSKIARSISREIKSRGYNGLVRLLLGSSLKDHQCGFKAFRRSRLLPLLDQVCDTHWFWDTELLIRAQRQGYSIIEFPVLWTEGPGTTVKNQDILKMGRSIMRLWWEIHFNKS